MSTYPFNERRDQVDINHCPAPFCGRRINRPWWTPITFAEDAHRSFADFEAEARPLDSYKYHALITCRRDECITWARLRAADIGGGPKTDPLVVRHQWMTSPYYRGEVDLGHGIRLALVRETTVTASG
jgi:hypothetical protein